MKESISTKFFGNVCPKCECEVARIPTKTKGQTDKQNMEVTCSECRTTLKVRKIGKFYGVSVK